MNEGYAISQRKRKRVEEVLGWMKMGSAAAQDALPWTGSDQLDVHVRGCGIQPGEDAKPSGSNRIGISVYEGCKTSLQTHQSSIKSTLIGPI